MSETQVVETVDAPQGEQEANAAISAGYNKAKGLPAEGAAAEKVEAKAEDTPAAAVVEKPADPWEGVSPIVRETLQGINGKLGALDTLTRDVKTTTGRVAAIQRELATAKEVAKTVDNAPTQEQITAAAKDPEEWAKLKEDFQEWTKATESYVHQQIATERAEMLKRIPQVDVDGIKREVGAGFKTELEKAKQEGAMLGREFARVDSKYPDWETDTRSPEFAAWAKAQAPEIQALADSDHARDAIKMLDMFYDHRKAEAKREKNQARLATVVAPRQANSGGPSVLPDEAGLSVGYTRIAKQRA